MGKNMIFQKLVVGAAAVATLGVAVAAEPVGKIARVQGSAVVSQGAQYVTAREGMSLRDGDRLMALEGGAVTIQFTDGCQHTLGDNEVMTLGTLSSCAAEAVGSYQVDPRTGVAKAPDGAGYLRQAALEPPTPPAPPVAIVPAAVGASWVPLAVGAVVVAGVAVAVNDDDDDDRNGISP